MTFLIITTQLTYSVAQSYLGATVVCQKPVVPHWGRPEYIYLLYSTLQQKTHTRTPCPDLLPHCYGHPSSTRSRPVLLPDGTLSLYHTLSTNILNLPSQKSITMSSKKAQHLRLRGHGYQPRWDLSTECHAIISSRVSVRGVGASTQLVSPRL